MTLSFTIVSKHIIIDQWQLTTAHTHTAERSRQKNKSNIEKSISKAIRWLDNEAVVGNSIKSNIAAGHSTYTHTRSRRVHVTIVRLSSGAPKMCSILIQNDFNASQKYQWLHSKTQRCYSLFSLHIFNSSQFENCF